MNNKCDLGNLSKQQRDKILEYWSAGRPIGRPELAKILNVRNVHNDDLGFAIISLWRSDVGAWKLESDLRFIERGGPVVQMATPIR